jgi:hypothetical protein
MGVSRKLAGAGVVAGLSALALVGSPALSSAEVTGTANVTVSGSKITTTVTGLSTTKAFDYCEGTVYRGDATVLDKSTKVGQSFYITGAELVKGQILTNASGAGTSADFAQGEYQVRTKCKEVGDTDYQDPAPAARVTITEDPAVVPGFGSLEDFFRDALNGVLSQFGS